jgi:hypothetical protein
MTHDPQLFHNSSIIAALVGVVPRHQPPMAHNMERRATCGCMTTANRMIGVTEVDRHLSSPTALGQAHFQASHLA